jgi:NAD(P)H-dependent flavin oxidoreductase YrpB (nitropropane dioxygenase family)
MILQALLGIEFPIIQAPMPGVQASALAVERLTLESRRYPSPRQ